jgi:hypothetical protein
MLTPPPLSVGGEAWVILQPRTPMKRLFKHKSPLKMNVEGHSAQGVVQVRWLQVGVLYICLFFYTSRCILAFH